MRSYKNTQYNVKIMSFKFDLKSINKKKKKTILKRGYKNVVSTTTWLLRIKHNVTKKRKEIRKQTIQELDRHTELSDFIAGFS